MLTFLTNPYGTCELEEGGDLDAAGVAPPLTCENICFKSERKMLMDKHDMMHKART